MGDNTQKCKDCGKACWGARCKPCSRRNGVRGHSRQNAKAQQKTIIPPYKRPEQRGSWWLEKPREDFTALADVMVVPDHKMVPYNWQVD